MSESDRPIPAGADLIAEWERARAAGTLRSAFADELGITENALSKRLVRARRKLGLEATNGSVGALASVRGVTPDCDLIDPDELWRRAFAAQDTAQGLIKTKRDQAISIPGDKPVGIAFLSDIHFGSAFTDYRAARTDAEIVKNTAGMYAGYHGDGWDNWIVEKLQRLERGQALPFDAELQLFAAYLRILKDKLLFAIPGNHDLWTRTLAGIDWVRELLRGTRILYDPYEIVFRLTLGAGQWTLKCRHQWRFSSIYNATHGVEVGWERGGSDFDIGLAGHTHIASLCRPFVKHGRKRYAVVTGTYKMADSYSDQIGYAPCAGYGCGVMIFYPDGRLQWFEDVKTAGEFLRFLRGGQGKAICEFAG